MANNIDEDTRESEPGTWPGLSLVDAGLVALQQATADLDERLDALGCLLRRIRDSDRPPPDD